jgi:hypothetical protein
MCNVLSYKEIKYILLNGKDTLEPEEYNRYKKNYNSIQDEINNYDDHVKYLFTQKYDKNKNKIYFDNHHSYNLYTYEYDDTLNFVKKMSEISCKPFCEKCVISTYDVNLDYLSYFFGTINNIGYDKLKMTTISNNHTDNYYSSLGNIIRLPNYSLKHEFLNNWRIRYDGYTFNKHLTINQINNFIEYIKKYYEVLCIDSIEEITMN